MEWRIVFSLLYKDILQSHWKREMRFLKCVDNVFERDWFYKKILELYWFSYLHDEGKCFCFNKSILLIFAWWLFYWYFKQRNELTMFHWIWTTYLCVSTYLRVLYMHVHAYTHTCLMCTGILHVCICINQQDGGYLQGRGDCFVVSGCTWGCHGRSGYRVVVMTAFTHHCVGVNRNHIHCITV